MAPLMGYMTAATQRFAHPGKSDTKRVRAAAPGRGANSADEQRMRNRARAVQGAYKAGLPIPWWATGDTCDLTYDPGPTPDYVEPEPEWQPEPPMHVDARVLRPDPQVYVPPRVAPAPRRPELVSLIEALDLGIVEEMNLGALRQAAKRDSFPEEIDRKRVSNAGSSEKRYRVSDLTEWNQNRLARLK